MIYDCWINCLVLHSNCLVLPNNILILLDIL